MEQSMIFYKYHLPFIACAILILAVSSIPKLQTPDLEISFLDKIAHALEYIILTILAIRSFGRIFSNKRHKIDILFVLFFCLIFAAIDEYHQSFIPGRFADIYDFYADSVGITIGLIINNLWRKSRGRRAS